ncbi:helix-turn-helix transcriptional regulator [Brevibacillus composti]|uniref:Helix-turn-helix transcriptional regulator n=1 Tax=Brevibacillus composti TaxID=2796470 RepID=A0A7T5JMB0_9BACL|nr:helix-turn-helix transcriptional regulator [Brevibacillus composti]QQE72929.1 helix-turn-helix transcriptional regulator [Brevibacillus composti]QUO40007.1 helix-turn-helix transcriptional regulator [Brevibacillus composti]
MQENSYTTEEIAKLLKISKLTVYDLIKKGELPAYRVGRQMRVDASDLEAYKARAKGAHRGTAAAYSPAAMPVQAATLVPVSAARSTQRQSVIISGQDVSLDLLADHLGKRMDSARPLRSYVGSINSLWAMYRGEADIVSTHLFDGDTGTYNIPYVRHILVGHRFLVVHLLSRWAGFYVQPGNPLGLAAWEDFRRPGVRMVNREKGSGARTLVEEQFRLHGIKGGDVAGYGREEGNHLSVAGAIARGEADIGVGIEKAAHLVGVEFLPMIEERYDLVLLKTGENRAWIEQVLKILRSPEFRNDLSALGGYNLTDTGKVVYETW